LLLSLAALALIAYGLSAKLDYAELGRTLAKLDVRWLCLALLVMVAQTAVAGVRLQLVASDVTGKVPQYRKCAAVHWLTLFISHGAPVAALGDLARFAVISSMLRLSLTSSFRVLLYDRLWGLFGMTLVGLTVLVAQFAGMEDHRLISAQLLAWIAVSGGFLLLFFLRRATPFVPGARVRHFLLIASGYFDAWRSRRSLLLQSLCAVAYVGLTALVFWVLAHALHLQLRLPYAIMFAPIILLAMSLPFFYAGWGAREAVVVATLGQSAGLGPVGALAVSLSYGVVYLLTSLPGGVIWMLNPGKVLPRWAPVKSEDGDGRPGGHARGA